jgi:hypothetical protein
LLDLGVGEDRSTSSVVTLCAAAAQFMIGPPAIKALFDRSSPAARCTVFPAQRRYFSTSDSRGIHRLLAPIAAIRRQNGTSPLADMMAARLAGIATTRRPCRLPNRVTNLRGRFCP